MSIKAMKQALEALETLNCGDSYKTHNAAVSLRKAIEDAQKQVPAYAGVKAWVGNKEITYAVTKVCIEHEAFEGLSMKLAADFCLKKLEEQNT